MHKTVFLGTILPQKLLSRNFFLQISSLLTKTKPMQLSCLGREKKMTQSDKMMSDEILVWVCCAEQDRASQMYSDHPHSKEASQTSLWCDTVARMLRNRFFLFNHQLLKRRNFNKDFYIARNSQRICWQKATQCHPPTLRELMMSEPIKM